MKIFIDKSLPQSLYKKLIENYGNTCEEKAEAGIVLLYAHDKNFRLSHLNEFNSTANKTELKKTIFFCWYNWNDPAQSSLFRDFFTPRFPYLWHTDICRFMQLPASIDDIEKTIKIFTDDR